MVENSLTYDLDTGITGSMPIYAHYLYELFPSFPLDDDKFVYFEFDSFNTWEFYVYIAPDDPAVKPVYNTPTYILLIGLNQFSDKKFRLTYEHNGRNQDLNDPYLSVANYSRVGIALNKKYIVGTNNKTSSIIYRSIPNVYDTNSNQYLSFLHNNNVTGTGNDNKVYIKEKDFSLKQNLINNGYTDIVSLYEVLTGSSGPNTSNKNILKLY